MQHRQHQQRPRRDSRQQEAQLLQRLSGCVLRQQDRRGRRGVRLWLRRRRVRRQMLLSQAAVRPREDQESDGQGVHEEGRHAVQVG